MKENVPAKRQAHVFYTGRVQGVGFRFTAQEAACDHGVSGWVKNLPNGQVEIIAQADENDLKEFLGAIFRSFRSSIQDVNISWEDPKSEFESFEIRF